MWLWSCCAVKYSCLPSYRSLSVHEFLSLLFRYHSDPHTSTGCCCYDTGGTCSIRAHRRKANTDLGNQKTQMHPGNSCRTEPLPTSQHCWTTRGFFFQKCEPGRRGFGCLIRDSLIFAALSYCRNIIHQSWKSSLDGWLMVNCRKRVS